MATHRLPILNFATVPDTRLTNGNVIIEPENINFSPTNKRYRHMLVRFANTSTKDGLAGKFKVPKNYVGNAKIIVSWSATVTTGNVVWVFDYTAVASGESLDPSADQESANTGTVTPNGTARYAVESPITLTSANLAVDDEVRFIFSRDGSTDTMNGDAYLFSLTFEYTDV